MDIYLARKCILARTEMFGLRPSDTVVSDASAAWPPGRLAAWPPGRLAAWPPGRLAAWPPGRLAAWPPGHLAAWPPGRLAAWPPGRLAAWPPGRLAAWPPGGCFMREKPETCMRDDVRNVVVDAVLLYTAFLRRRHLGDVCCQRTSDGTQLPSAGRSASATLPPHDRLTAEMNSEIGHCRRK